MKKGLLLIMVLTLCAVSGALAEKGLVAAFPPESPESGIAQDVAEMLDLPLTEDEDAGSAANRMLADPECVLLGSQDVLIAGLQGYTELDLRQAMTPVCAVAVSPLFLVMDRDVSEELGITGFDSLCTYISQQGDECDVTLARHLEADPVDRAVTRLAYELNVLTDYFEDDEITDALREGEALAAVFSAADLAEGNEDWLLILCLGAERDPSRPNVPCAAEAGLTPSEGFLVGLYMSAEASVESVDQVRAAVQPYAVILPAGYVPSALSASDYAELVSSLFVDYMGYMTAEGIGFYEE